MRRQIMAMGWVVALMWAPSAGAAGDQWVALVTAEKGAASFSGASTHGDLHALTRLPSDSSLQLEPGASVTIAFIKGGQRVTLTGPLKAHLGADSVTTEQGTVVKGSAIKEYQASLMPSGENLDRLGGIASRDGKAVPPTLAFVQSPPVLDLSSFSGNGAVTSFDIKIKNKANRRTVLAVDGKAVQFTLSAAEMASHTTKTGAKPIDIVDGEVYYVDITAYRASGPQDGATYRIKVLSEADRAQLGTAAREAMTSYRSHPQDVTPVALMGAFYEEHNSFAEAARKIEQLQGLHPEVDELQQVFKQLSDDIKLANSRAREAHADSAFDGDVQ